MIEATLLAFNCYSKRTIAQTTMFVKRKRRLEENFKIFFIHFKASQSRIIYKTCTLKSFCIQFLQGIVTTLRQFECFPSAL